MRTGESNSLMNGSSSARMPLRPASNACQVPSASGANAVVDAMPVTTTLGNPLPVLSAAMPLLRPCTHYVDRGALYPRDLNLLPNEIFAGPGGALVAPARRLVSGLRPCRPGRPNRGPTTPAHQMRRGWTRGTLPRAWIWPPRRHRPTLGAVVYLFGVVAAVLLAVGFVLQHHAAEDEPDSLRLSPRLLLHLAARRRRLLGIAAMVAGQEAGAAALSRGAVALVEPLLAANLLFALPLTALYHRRRIRVFDTVGALVLMAGLALFITTGHPAGGSTRAPQLTAWVAAFGAVAVAVIVVLIAQRDRQATLAAVLLATGAGMLFGMQDTLTRDVDRLAIRGIVSLFTSWTPYVLVAVGVIGLFLAQSAFEAAPLRASLPTITATEPLAGIALGIGLYGETMSTTPLALACEALGLAAIVAGVIILGRSPLVTGQHRRHRGDDVGKIPVSGNATVHHLGRGRPGRRPHRLNLGGRAG